MDPSTTSGLSESRLALSPPIPRRARIQPGSHPARFAAFIVAGLLGLATQLGMTALLYGRLHLPLGAATALAIQTAILVTFTVNSKVTWRDRAAGRPLRRSLITFELVSLVGLGLNLAVVLTAADVIGLHYLVATLCGAASASCWNYLANHLVTFRSPRPGGAGQIR
ncbi:MAG TPA: GtrA family protein [Verrucomicrobiae bacterium]|nr:GtrA family protein [Verrucomicrobiae bacterium]